MFLLGTPAATWLGLAAVVGTFVGVRALCSARGLPKPGQFAIVGSALVAAALLSSAGLAPTDLGLGAPPNWGHALLLGVGLAVAAMATVGIVGYPIVRLFGWARMRPDAFGDLHGRPRVLLTMLAMVWTTVSFGEEFVFRGFLQQGLAGVLSATTQPSAVVATVAIAMQAIVFGALHWSLGAMGVLNATLAGLVFGAGLHATDGNLWPLVIAHGLVDTVGMIVLYRGRFPR